MRKYFLLLACLLIVCIATVTAKPIKGNKKTEGKGSLTLRFKNMVDGAVLRLNDSAAFYKNANGDDFKVTTFKYYVSNVVLTNRDGHTVPVPDTYFLINAADSSSLDQKIANIPDGKYTAISFIIGIDSLHNFAGAQTGALDPANGMFWTWNSGYIFVKLEGVSPKSTAKKNRLTFHIGGAKAPDNTIRTFTQKLNKTLKIVNGKTPELELVADAGALFKGKTTVDFTKLNFTMGGPNSVIVADNYAEGLFKVGKIKN